MKWRCGSASRSLIESLVTESIGVRYRLTAHSVFGMGNSLSSVATVGSTSTRAVISGLSMANPHSSSTTLLCCIQHRVNNIDIRSTKPEPRPLHRARLNRKLLFREHINSVSLCKVISRVFNNRGHSWRVKLSLIFFHEVGGCDFRHQVLGWNTREHHRNVVSCRTRVFNVR